MRVQQLTPSRQTRKGLHSLLFLILVGLLTSCSALSLTYHYADWLLFWRVDHYFDLSSYQKPVLQTHLTHLHSWHREQEIPRYVAFLETIHRHWQDGLTQQELDEIFDQYAVLRGRLGSQVASESVEFLNTVNSEQILHLEEVMQAENEEWLAELGEDLQTRKANRVERVLGWLRTWFGEIPPDQEQGFTEVIEQYPDTIDQWMEFRRYRQQQFATLLRSNADSQALEKQVHDWLVTPEKDAPPSYIEYVSYRNRNLKETILAIDLMVTPVQRQHGSDRLQNLIQEVDHIGRH
ncbi:MAG: hypothetical protein JSU59_11100 [Nitrospirota bacterium]|nr:MAG: hypothetical protein JSU59_11100 [Nitrospirota bacterium]